jgi:hypothetical protein
MIPYRMHTHFLGHHIVNGTQNRVLEHAYLPTSPISKSLFKTRLIFFSFVAFPMHFSKIIGSYFACLRLKKGYYSWINLQICVGLYKGPMDWDWFGDISMVCYTLRWINIVPTIYHWILNCFNWWVMILIHVHIM